MLIYEIMSKSYQNQFKKIHHSRESYPNNIPHSYDNYVIYRDFKKKKLATTCERLRSERIRPRQGTIASNVAPLRHASKHYHNRSSTVTIVQPWQHDAGAANI